jgi:hypothetical protein
MRVIADIPHERYKIQIFSYNSKYIVKIELGQFEQVFKIGEIDVIGLEEVKNMISDELLSNCLQRFVSMRADWEKSFANKNSINNSVI